MKITIVTCESGEWYGLYFDNVLKTEGHSIRYDELLDFLVKTKEVVEEWTTIYLEDSYVEDLGNLPSHRLEIDLNYQIL